MEARWCCRRAACRRAGAEEDRPTTGLPATGLRLAATVLLFLDFDYCFFLLQAFVLFFLGILCLFSFFF